MMIFNVYTVVVLLVSGIVFTHSIIINNNTTYLATYILANAKYQCSSCFNDSPVFSFHLAILI
jgi:hypothetical protein